MGKVIMLGQQVEAESGGSKAAYIIGGLVLAVGGAVGGYYLYKDLKSREMAAEGGSEDEIGYLASRGDHNANFMKSYWERQGEIYTDVMSRQPVKESF